MNQFSSIRALLVVALAVGLGYIVYSVRQERMQLSRLENELRQLRVAAAERSHAPSECATPSGFDARLVDAVAARVAAQLRERTAPSAPATGAPPAAADSAPTRTAADERALGDARHVLERALGSGRLRKQDVIEMHARLASVPRNDESIRELMSQIAVAINTGKLVPEDRRFVYP
jgi:hypothetical protein